MLDLMHWVHSHGIRKDTFKENSQKFPYVGLNALRSHSYLYQQLLEVSNPGFVQLQASTPSLPFYVQLSEKRVMALLQHLGEALLSVFFQTVFQELTGIILKGLNSSWDLNPELEKLKRKLAKVQSVIDDAERRRYTELDVNYWVVDLRELIYNLDDTLGEMKNELEKADKSQHAVRNIFSASKKKVHKILSFPIDKYQEVQFKSKIKGFLDRLDGFVKAASDLNLSRNSSGSSSASGQARARETSPVVDESEVYGREEDKKSIIELLFAEGSEQNKKNYDVIPIVGMGGIGKTTVAQLVFQDERVKTQFDLRSWACVSDVFDVSRVTRELVEYTTKNNCPDRSLAALQDRLENMVRGKRFFIVLDDIWTKKEWDSMKAPLNHCAKGSIILITTRDKAVAKAIGSMLPYELRSLDEEQCWNLFKGEAFGKVDSDVDENLVQLGKAIAQKCRGVPLAVKVLGGMLQDAEPERWEAVLRNELWDLPNDGDEIFPALRLSYYSLTSPLKRCFEYLSLFPTDYKFDEEKLVYMRIGEGFILSKGGRILEDIGKQYFNDLKKRCLIQEDNKIHDLVHSLACTISPEFYCRLQSDEKPPKSLARARHASLFGIHQVGDGQIRLLEEATRLRTLMLFGERSHGLLEKFSEWRWLRVVDLSWSGISELPLDNLKHLRYLDVSWNKRLRVLPDAVCELYNFQYLSLAHCGNIEILPEELGNLLNLRYLNLSSTKISSLPKSICKLYNLQVLDLRSCCSLAELPENIGDLLNLRDLNLSSTGISSLPKSICKLYNLQVLYLADCDSLAELPENIGDLLNLRHLYLSSTEISSLPKSICKLYNLQVLDLAWCCSLAELPENIGDLHSLRELKIQYSAISCVPDSIVKATNLQNLYFGDASVPPYLGKLTSLQELKEYPVRKESGRGIEELKDMNNLRGLLIISGLENIESVEEAEMADMKSKKHITDLGQLVVREGQLEVKVLEALEPHLTTLTALSLKYYSGDVFPKWMICKNCSFSLTSLDMFGLHRASRLVGVELPSLVNLYIRRCPRLREVSMAAPKLTNLEVEDCQELKLTAIALFATLENKTSVNLLTQLENLRINRSQLECLPLLIQAADDHHGVPLKLKKLTVKEGQDDKTTFPMLLRNLTSLETLEIRNFSDDDNQDSFPSSLTKLSINDCVSLPKALRNCTSLKDLRISCCPQLTTFEEELLPTSLTTFQIEVRPDDRLPPSLQKFYVLGCPKLKQQLKQECRTDWPIPDFILKY